VCCRIPREKPGPITT
jgi:factor associated with neutral sphingomyelinase activation